MYNTKDMMKKQNNNHIIVPVKTIQEHYNSFQTGYGFHDKTGRAKHKLERRNSKKEIREYCN